MIDTTTVRQQHGYLTMQFTRSLQSLGDDYGYIFDTQAADRHGRYRPEPPHPDRSDPSA